MKRDKKYHGFIGLAILLVSEILMLADVRPFTTWFYSLAWWSYIFIVDQAVYQYKGNSLWVNRRREFLLLIPMSAVIWMIFEGFNAYLRNWLYIGVTETAWLRWLGYFIAFSTVLPGMFETADLLETLGLYKNSRVKAIPRTTSWYLPFTIVGILFLFLPVFWPQYFFSLIWGGFVFLLEPAVHARGGRSLMREWENGSLRTFFLLLTAGLICGLLWEFWNFWAETKWVYNVPYVGQWKIFEMPVLGFGGFPPFAVECYVIMAALSLFRGGRSWQAEDARRGQGASPFWIVVGILLFFYIFILCGRIIDTLTVIEYV